MHLDNDQVSYDDLGAIHNDLVSLPYRVVQGHSPRVGPTVAKIGEIASPLAAVPFNQFERVLDVSLGAPLSGRPSYGGRRPLQPAAAAVGLEQVLDTVTAVSLAVGRGAHVPSEGVEQLCQALDAVSQAASDGTPVPASLKLPDDETLQPVTEAVRALLGVASGERSDSAAA